MPPSPASKRANIVLVVDNENTAQQRYVTLGQLVDKLRVVKDGLKPDDRIIVNGLMRARPGAKVTPEDQAQASATPATTK